jgi:hypothetical protein
MKKAQILLKLLGFVDCEDSRYIDGEKKPEDGWECWDHGQRKRGRGTH